MKPSIPLDRMTIPEKLRALEEIWDNLQRNADALPSPAWHEDVLRARETRAQEGTSQCSEWSDAKQRILDHTR